MKECTLEIKDEVNVRFVGIDPNTRRKMTAAVKYFLPHARHTPAYKLGRWDGTVSFCDIGGRTYINLLDIIVPIVQDAGYTINIEDSRESCEFEFDEVDTQSFAHIKWPEGHPMAGKSIELRDHQVQLLNSYYKNLQCLSICPTGGGKTLVSAAMSYAIQKYGKSFIIVPSVDLVKQTEEDYINFGLDVGVYYGNRKDLTKTHTICTWQSLESLNKKDPDALTDAIDGTVGVIVDECFAPGTQVLTPTGYVSIESLQPGDKVINYSEKHQHFKEDTVVKLHENLTHTQSERMYEMEMDTGDIIKVTGNHKFLTRNRGWVRADELVVDDEIVDFNK